jgi:hypothetical protein
VEATPSLSERTTRLLFWAGLAVLVGGTIFFVVKVFGGDGETTPQAASNPPPPPLTVPGQKNVDRPRQTLQRTGISRDARLVAGKFILTAVARKHLAESWKYIHPEMKAGYTLKQWKTGNIPVVPYPVDGLEQARFRIDYRQGNTIQLKVALIPKKGVDIDAAIFDLGLRRVGKGDQAHWLVDYWAPFYEPPVRDVPAR